MISSFYERIVGSSPPPEKNEPKILCVGICCLDIVQTCKQFPAEDSDQRSVDYAWQRGGNASNTCTILSMLGCQCEFLGRLSTEEHLVFLQNDMKKYKISFAHCPVIEGIGCPTSTIILSLSTGSRTIVHHNPKMPELTLEDFERLSLDEYSWVHFEGRNVPNVLSMMQHVESYNNSLKSAESTEKTRLHKVPITISVELESPKPELLDLLPYADVAFISKDFAQSRGFDNMSETVRHISEEAKSGATIICAWGDRGAMAHTPDGIIVQSPAFAPKKIVDSLGAGDTFNAAVLYYLNKSKLKIFNNKTELYPEAEPKREAKHNYNIESLECSQAMDFIDTTVLQSAITFACRVAGAKIGHKSYDGLQKILKNIPES